MVYRNVSLFLIEELYCQSFKKLVATITVMEFKKLTLMQKTATVSNFMKVIDGRNFKSWCSQRYTTHAQAHQLYGTYCFQNQNCQKFDLGMLNKLDEKSFTHCLMVLSLTFF